MTREQILKQMELNLVEIKKFSNPNPATLQVIAWAEETIRTKGSNSYVGDLLNKPYP